MTERSGLSLIERAPERYTLWVCQDCAQPAHGPGSRCPRDKRRTWTQMGEVQYVRADVHAGAVREAKRLREWIADEPSVAFRARAEGLITAAEYVTALGRRGVQ